jgi:hypothetical protein
MRRKLPFLLIVFLITFFSVQSQPIEQIKKILPSDGEASELFGLSVDISGNYAIVGMPHDDDYGVYSGSAYIFQKDEGGTNEWQQIKKLIGSDFSSNDYFGHSVSISGNYAAVSAWYDDEMGSDAGAVYIFSINEGGTNNWGEIKKITAFDGNDYDQFGSSVDINGEYLIVGANGDKYSGYDYGSAYIYKKDEGGTDNWGYVQKLWSSDPGDNDNFGWAVAICSDYAIVGAKFDDDNGSNAGTADIYKRTEGGTDNWGHIKKLNPASTEAGDEFGFSVDINNDFAAAGAYKHTIPSGSDGEGVSYVFARDEGGADNWGETNMLQDPNPGIDDYFGYSVNLDENYLLIGAEQDEINGTRCGAAHLFHHDGSTWTYVDSLLAGDGASYDRFGGAVSINNGYATISSRYDDDNGTSSGSAYIFGQPVPEITAHPASQNEICSGTVINVSVDGNYIDEYQWQESNNGGATFINLSNNTTYSGVQTNTLSLLFDAGMDDYQYRCMVFNRRDSSYSNIATLNTDTQNPSLSIQDITISLDSDGNAEVTPADLVTSASDNCSVKDTLLSNSIFSCSETGPNLVDVTLTDESGNSVTKTATIDVQDDLPPDFEAVNVTLELDASGSAQIQKEEVVTDVSDNCQVTDTTISQANFSCNDLGTNTVTVMISDGYQNTTKNLTVTVEDRIAPSLELQDISRSLDTDGTIEITADEIITSASDNCSLADTSISQQIFTCSNIGEQTIQVEVSDLSGNSTIMESTITITDNQQPALVTQTTTIDLDENGNAELNPEDIILSAVDNCEIDTLLSQSEFYCNDTGTAQVEVTIEDQAGNSQSELVDVYIEDNIAPTLDVTDTTIELNETGNASLSPEMVVVSAADNCSPADTTLSQYNFSSSDVGTVNIDVVLTDPTGNTTTKPTTVKVLENQSPVLVVIDTTVHLNETGMGSIDPSWVIASASDNHIISDTVLSQAEFDCSNIGQSNIDITITDLAGNSTTLQTSVTVKDTLSPVPNNSSLNTVSGECEVIISNIPEATDNCGGNIEARTNDTLEYTDQGTYTLTWIYNDGNGNSATQQQTVIVDDVTSPAITCVEDQTMNLTEGQTIYTVQGDEFDPVDTSDNCSVNNLTNNYNQSQTLNGAEFNPGTTTVTWVISDEAGNENQCSFNVTVNEAPNQIENLANSGIIIYPNPVKNRLLYHSENKQIQSIFVSDLTGKTLIKKYLLKEKGFIDLKSLENGIYIIQITTSEGHFSTKILKE